MAAQNPLAGLFALPIIGPLLKTSLGKGLQFLGQSIGGLQQSIIKAVGAEPLIIAALIGQVLANGLKSTPLPPKVAKPLQFITLAIGLLTARQAVASPATQQRVLASGSVPRG